VAAGSGRGYQAMLGNSDLKQDQVRVS
jgi:hypothetical protein